MTDDTQLSLQNQIDRQRRQRNDAENAVAEAAARTDAWPEHRSVLLQDFVRVLEQWRQRLRQTRQAGRNLVRLFRRLSGETRRTRNLGGLTLAHPKAWLVRGEIVWLWWLNYWQVIVGTIAALFGLVLFIWLLILAYEYVPVLVAEVLDFLQGMRFPR